MKLNTLFLASALIAGAGAIALAQTPPAGGGGGGGRGAMQAACGADIQANCAGQTGRGVRQCLTDNQAKLSDGCKAALAAAPARGAGGGGGGGGGQ